MSPSASHAIPRACSIRTGKPSACDDFGFGDTGVGTELTALAYWHCMRQKTGFVLEFDGNLFWVLRPETSHFLCAVSQVDVTSVHSPTGLPWMRLVQAAANSKEQNLEAYLENSQLYYRSTRKINKNEELLVWYDEELSSLLGFNEIKAQSPQNGKY